MDKRNKISGTQKSKFILQNSRKYFDDSEKHQIIQEFLATGCSKRDIWHKYTGQTNEHGHLLRWMRNLGYDTTVPLGRSIFENNSPLMAKKKKTAENQSIDEFESLQLKKRISELENQLRDAELKAVAFSTMVDIAEKEFNIPIRKKYNTKPLKK